MRLLTINIFAFAMLIVFVGTKSFAQDRAAIDQADAKILADAKAKASFSYAYQSAIYRTLLKQKGVDYSFAEVTFAIPVIDGIYEQSIINGFRVIGALYNETLAAKDDRFDGHFIAEGIIDSYIKCDVMISRLKTHQDLVWVRSSPCDQGGGPYRSDYGAQKASNATFVGFLNLKTGEFEETAPVAASVEDFKKRLK